MPYGQTFRSCDIGLAALVAFTGFGLPVRSDDLRATNAGGTFTAEQQNLWSFQPIERPPVPAVKDSAWVRNAIDAFVLAKLEAAALAPSLPASKRQLIRRATLDLIGLPPTPEEVEAFLADDRADSYEKLVDRLLASRQYGERWARSWLDLCRYAESDGFKSDNTRPHAWRYRDYVIQSLNEDKPYDQFIREQIAGDEIDPTNAAALIATGFNRHWADEDNARNLVLRRQEILNDITDTTAAVFLGLSLGCARCHDHKYDPITQRDYYRFQAFFAATQPVDRVAVTDGDPAHYRDQMKQWEDATAEIRTEMATIEEPVKGKMIRETTEKFIPEVQEALATEPAKRTPLERQLANLAETHMEISTEAMVGKMAKGDRERWTQLRDSLSEFDRLKPAVSAVAMVLTDVGGTAPKTHLLRRGAYSTPEDEVEPGILSFFDARPSTIPQPDAAATSTGRRAALADWIVSPDNPFTARVMVNRIWQGHFGRGLVATPSDFGMQGDPPTHPDLLDWLASEFVARGWSLKEMHRLVLLSNTYQQASTIADCEINNPQSAIPNPQLSDPDNRLLWRMNRQRLDAEAIRDSILFVSGRLNPQSGGPSVRPDLPAGLSDRYGWKSDKEPAQRNRRSVYVFVRRNLRYPLFELFDMPDTNETCGRRNRTTTAPQALFVLNSDLILGEARAMAGRILCDVGTDRGAAIGRAYRLAFTRDPSSDELTLSREFLERQAAIVRERITDSQRIALPDPMPPQLDPADGAAFTDLCHALLNANEFIYVD
jgi:hypothetical protein